MTREFTPEQKEAQANYWENDTPLKPADYPLFNFNVSVFEKSAECESMGFLGLGNREISESLCYAEHPDQIQLSRYIQFEDGLMSTLARVAGTTVHVSPNGFFACEFRDNVCAFHAIYGEPLSGEIMRAITERNERWGIEPSAQLKAVLGAPFPLDLSMLDLFEPWEPSKPQAKVIMPVALAHPTFLEARRVCESLSDGRDGRNWAPIEGVIALLHNAPKSTHSIRFDPSARLLNWWGTSGAQIEGLRAELARLSLDDIILFRVVLSAVLHDEKARFSASLDDIITLIGRDTDARRSAQERKKWRAKVWRSIVLFESLAVVGTRGGTWKEPAAKGEKRPKMDAQTLYTRDPLLLISGTRDTEQGTFDGSAPPKTVSLVPGDWLMEFHGNREVLSEFGDVLPIAQIPRGKPSGAWAACAGLSLSQLWREQATRATVGRNSRGKEDKVEVLKFRAFTRRELLAGTFRSDYDVNEILNDPKSGHRARDYWKAAVKELKTRGIISHYAELESTRKPSADWRKAWLDQPLDIRPAGEMLADALEIHKLAQVAKKRGTRKRALPKAQSAKDDE